MRAKLAALVNIYVNAEDGLRFSGGWTPRSRRRESVTILPAVAGGDLTRHDSLLEALAKRLWLRCTGFAPLGRRPARAACGRSGGPQTPQAPRPDRYTDDRGASAAVSLSPGAIILEPTSGNTGISMARPRCSGIQMSA